MLFWADNAQHKRKLLDHWLRDTTINQAIVFASTQVECDGLANDLQQDGFSAVALHGALSQGLRNRRLMALRQGQVQILVATDVAARGIDVPTITHVFNFGLPMKAEDYTHRIGRTGRAGRDGLAVTFAEFRDRRKIFDIEAYSRQQFKAEVIPGLEPQQRAPQVASARRLRRPWRAATTIRAIASSAAAVVIAAATRWIRWRRQAAMPAPAASTTAMHAARRAGAPRGFQNQGNAGFGGGRDERLATAASRAGATARPRGGAGGGRRPRRRFCSAWRMPAAARCSFRATRRSARFKPSR